MQVINNIHKYTHIWNNQLALKGTSMFFKEAKSLLKKKHLKYIDSHLPTYKIVA